MNRSGIEIGKILERISVSIVRKCCSHVMNQNSSITYMNSILKPF